MKQHAAIQALITLANDLDPAEHTRMNQFFSELGRPDPNNPITPAADKKLSAYAKDVLKKAKQHANDQGGIGWADPLAKLGFAANLISFIESSSTEQEAILRAGSVISLMSHWRESGDFTIDADDLTDRSAWAGIRISVWRAVNTVHALTEPARPAVPPTDRAATVGVSPDDDKSAIFSTPHPRNIHLN